MRSDLYQYFFSLMVHQYSVTSPHQSAGCHLGCAVLYLCKWHLLSVFSMAKIQVRDLRSNLTNPSLHEAYHLLWLNKPM